ncbi:MAG TPA: hypothetical protein VKR24_08885 [Candidatus Limnocylindrales bacterium]|nr:hypothetical protein [Candidatus Limnocylindrales bacterium]
MTSSSDALRTTSDALLRDLEVLGTLEEEKRTIEPGDPRLVDLASQIESIAKRVLSGSVRQRRLSEVVSDQVRDDLPGAPTASIDATERHPGAILADWREAERRLAAADPASAEWTESEAMVDLLREEYRRASRRS